VRVWWWWSCVHGLGLNFGGGSCSSSSSMWVPGCLDTVEVLDQVCGIARGLVVLATWLHGRGERGQRQWRLLASQQSGGLLWAAAAPCVWLGGDHGDACCTGGTCVAWRKASLACLSIIYTGCCSCVQPTTCIWGTWPIGWHRGHMPQHTRSVFDCRGSLRPVSWAPPRCASLCQLEVVTRNRGWVACNAGACVRCSC
jgi:hypothetical protein